MPYNPVCHSAGVKMVMPTMGKMIKKIWKSKMWLLITVVLLVSINWLASLYHSRIDFTNEKRFTLSSATKNVLNKLDDVVQHR